MILKPIFNTRLIEILYKNFGVETENIVDRMDFDITNDFNGYEISVLFVKENREKILETILTSSHINGTQYTYLIPDEITSNKKVLYQIICKKDSVELSSSYLWKSKIYELYFRNK